MITCKEAVIDAIKKLGRVVSSREVINYIYRKFPDKPWKEVSIRCHLTGLSVNHPSSKHYPTLNRQAYLFYVGNGKYKLYDPEKDDIEDTNLQEEEPSEGIEDEEILTEAVISLEKDLEEYIVRNLSQIESGLKLYSEERVSGRQFNTDVGRIDILAIDTKDNFIVIELKAGKANYSVIGQALSYISWVRQNIARGKEVRGIIIADDFDKKLKYASSETANITPKQYEVNFTFKDVKKEAAL
jgi:hypothetical protein